MEYLIQSFSDFEHILVQFLSTYDVNLLLVNWLKEAGLLFSVSEITTRIVKNLAYLAIARVTASTFGQNHHSSWLLLA